ncbi:MAG: HAD hydrolase-like protein [Brevefilum sp.]
MRKNKKRVLLFDIDGTLVDPQGEGHTCMRLALQDVFGTAGPIETYDMSGKTDWQIVTELMQLAGLEAHKIKTQRQAAFRAYAWVVAREAPNLVMDVLPGVPALLNQLAGDERFLLGLLTGNVREAVPHKLRAAGLNPDIFQFGAYGSEHIDRNELPPLALERAGRLFDTKVSPEAALIIGDTPRDIACARNGGLKVLSVATGWFSKEELAVHNPDYLLDDLGDLDLVMGILSAF